MSETLRDYVVEIQQTIAEMKFAPCPFCGGKPYAHRAVNGTDMFHVGCSPCGFKFKAAWYRGKDKPTRDLCAVWNRRASDSRREP